MPCYSPDIELLDISTNPKRKLAWISHYDITKFKGYEYYEEENEHFKERNEHIKYYKIPCGSCAGCQEAHSKEWATRMMLEASLWHENYFITLTYDDEHLPKGKIIDPKTGKEYQSQEQGYVKKKDIQDYHKRLRKHYANPKNGFGEEGHQGIRHYTAAEYGNTTGRAHYHEILFNFPIPKKELKVHKIENGNPIFKYPRLEEIWGNGFISVAEVNWDTCAYVARYVMKKLKYRAWDKTYYENGRTPEFNTMSNRPGIGLGAFKEDYYNFDEIIIPGHSGTIQSVKPSRYFDKKYDEINPENMAKIRESRERAALENLKLKMSQTTLTEAEQLRIEEKQKRAAWKTLQRNKI